MWLDALGINDWFRIIRFNRVLGKNLKLYRKTNSDSGANDLGFSHAHLHRFSNAQHDYLKAARTGYEFLLEHFLDKEQGGYFWTIDLEGKPIDQRKLVYGESFVIYGLVEYYLASGDKAALQQALDLYKVVQNHAHDFTNGGWIEHFEGDWTPILEPIQSWK